MKTILLVHGPNLNALGRRDRAQYGTGTLKDIESVTKRAAKSAGLKVIAYQSNHEGDLIDFLQKKSAVAAGIIINPGALTHYSYALHDALVDTGLPCVEVHLSDIYAREEWRRKSVTATACIAQVSGKKEKGYAEAIELLREHLHSNV